MVPTIYDTPDQGQCQRTTHDKEDPDQSIYHQLLTELSNEELICIHLITNQLLRTRGMQLPTPVPPACPPDAVDNAKYKQTSDTKKCLSLKNRNYYFFTLFSVYYFSILHRKLYKNYVS
jgi:hypothetical protein